MATGLKQKIVKLEEQCKEKDNTIKYDFDGAGGRGLANKENCKSMLFFICVLFLKTF